MCKQKNHMKKKMNKTDQKMGYASIIKRFVLTNVQQTRGEENEEKWPKNGIPIQVLRDQCLVMCKRHTKKKWVASHNLKKLIYV